MSADPFQPFFMLFVLQFGNRFEKPVVASSHRSFRVVASLVEVSHTKFWLRLISRDIIALISLSSSGQ